jgi:hypothetical protein
MENIKVGVLEKLKDFDTWKSWKNGDIELSVPISEISSTGEVFK